MIKNTGEGLIVEMKGYNSLLNNQPQIVNQEENYYEYYLSMLDSAITPEEKAGEILDEINTEGIVLNGGIVNKNTQRLAYFLATKLIQEIEDKGLEAIKVIDDRQKISTQEDDLWAEIHKNIGASMGSPIMILTKLIGHLQENQKLRFNNAFYEIVNGLERKIKTINQIFEYMDNNPSSEETRNQIQSTKGKIRANL